ncbi:hypothetical protein RM572_26935 [Streptomyces sp. DSM 42041]|uniref:Uncharacterized protein n=1 Tax=Streptomyces hazeniae TaxID=3075538 RepID=A0ABU2NZI9_9ACTN|nr:hypothetical protein [Streptomyces sp. DSM 42041]MDT0382400.1 hypothetical protein [Streptomyces sp. DSM 42041]
MTQTTTAEQQADEVTAAEQEAREADDLLAALEERVRDGDDKITPQQLTEQRELGRFARLRAEAARRKADRAAAKAAEKHRAEQIARAVDLADTKGNRAAIAAKYDAALAAVAELVAVVEQHDQAVTEAGRMLRAAECAPSIEYESVQQGEVMVREPRRMPATRTAPRVDTNPHAVAFTFGEGTRAPVTPGAVLAVLFSKAAAGDAGRMPHGEGRLAAAALDQHARKHRAAVGALLDAATTNGK